MNPEAGGGNCRRRWTQIERELAKKIGPFDFEETTAIGHARMMALDAAQAGYPFVVACGGDGTIHEVVNGFFDSGVETHPTLGILSMGTGSDLIKTLKIPFPLREQMKILAAGKTRKMDLGLVEYTNMENRKEKRVFVNITDAGIGAEVVRRLCETRGLFGKRLAYLMSTLRSYIAWPAREIRITTDHSEIHWPKKCLAVAIANGRYFGGGMPIAPTADPVDGYFDIVAISDLNWTEALLAIPLLYAGQLRRLRGVQIDRAKKIILDSDERVGLDIDGELIGTLPASFEVLPLSLNVLCP